MVSPFRSSTSEILSLVFVSRLVMRRMIEYTFQFIVALDSLCRVLISCTRSSPADSLKELRVLIVDANCCSHSYLTCSRLCCLLRSLRVIIVWRDSIDASEYLFWASAPV